MSPLRIAVVGAGPKGLYCLERLAAEFRRTRDLTPLEIHIFEPHPCPGAGPVYDPTQPHYLRMNFANGKIDMWPRDIGRLEEQALSGPTFVEYLNSRGVAASDGDYAARAVVGDYLHNGFERVVECLRYSATVRIHRESVLSIGRRGEGFEVETSAQSLTCSEVLLATGHRSRTSGASPGLSPYPINSPGGVCDIEPGATVALRGMGLTAIDVALALTEGRGGRFVPSSVPGGLEYQASGFEAGVVLPFSRTGRPMAPKPHPELMPETKATAMACEKGSRLLTDNRTCCADSVTSALVATSTALLGHAKGGNACEAHIYQHLERLLSRGPTTADESVREMRGGVDIAYGQRPPGPDWALGTAWRGMYPALVRLVATRQLDDSWPTFASLATEMERVAFGPPAENAARLLALVDAGFVDLSCAADPCLTETKEGFLLEAGADTARPVVLVNAVLDPAGAAPNPAPPVDSLLRAGLARTTAHSPGLDVQSDGTCIGAAGEPTVGLATVGRPTEGSILGNDTLSRRLHDTPALWARTVTRRLHSLTEASSTEASLTETSLS